MSLPVKPWDMSPGAFPGVTNSSTLPYIPNTNTDRLHSSPIPYPGTGGGGMNSTVSAPPLPPRPGQTRPIYSAYNRSATMPYSNPYSTYSGSLYNNPYSTMGMGMGSYSSYGGYGGGMYGNRPYGFGSTPYNNELTFTQLAEESSASAFQSIESFVSAFGSISAMLESTFTALYSSFRAVVGVADHLGRVKQILSALAIFRFFKWVYRRVLYLIGISKIKPEDVESLWKDVSSAGDSSEWSETESMLNPMSKPSSWPILMFLGFIFAGPYLMWKLIASFNINPANKVENNKWATGEADHFVAVSQYDFEGMPERELTMKKGQNIRLAPSKCQPPHVKGWVLASDGVKIGLIPTNYIKILGKRSSSSIVECTPALPIPNQPYISKPLNVIHEDEHPIP